MKNIIINIPNMQSTHCQTRVKNALRDIETVQVEKLEPGKLTISFEDEMSKSEALDAVKQAGYIVSAETENTAPSCTTGCCAD